MYGQNFDSKIKRNEQNISYERRVYDSVDDKPTVDDLSQKTDEKKKTRATKG